jgi:hypothetical protein
MVEMNLDPISKKGMGFLFGECGGMPNDMEEFRGDEREARENKRGLWR